MKQKKAELIQLIQSIGITRALLVVNIKPKDATCWRDMDCVVTPFEHLYYKYDDKNKLLVWDVDRKCWSVSIANNNKKGSGYIYDALIDLNAFELEVHKIANKSAKIEIGIDVAKTVADSINDAVELHPTLGLGLLPSIAELFEGLIEKTEGNYSEFPNSSSVDLNNA